MGKVDTSKLNILLSDQQTVESLTYLVSKLPEYTARMKQMEEPLLFIEEVLKDQEWLEQITDEAEQAIQSLKLTKESVSSLVRIIEILPIITPYLDKGIELAEFGRNTLKDPTSFQSITSDIHPYIETVQKCGGILQETNRRVHMQETEKLSLFKVLALLKIPAVKRGFQYMKTFLQVLSEKK